MKKVIKKEAPAKKCVKAAKKPTAKKAKCAPVKKDPLLEEICKFIFEYSNVCWNLAKEKEHKKAQEMGVWELKSRMPKLCREFLAVTAEPGSPFNDVIEILDESIAQFEKMAADAKAANKKCGCKKPAKKGKKAAK